MLEQKFQRFSWTEKFFSLWQAFATYRSASSSLKENVLTFGFIWKVIILYNIIVLFRIEVLMLFTSIDDIYLIGFYF